MKTFIIILVGVAVLFGASIWWSNGHTSSDIIATQGIHWHPELQIFVDSKPVEIPQHIGLTGAVESPIHTHEDLPLIHLEFPGIVHKSDITLGKFFQVWGKDFHSFGQNVVMTVNGTPNTEYENYVMRDGDKIVLNYTTSTSTATSTSASQTTIKDYVRANISTLSRSAGVPEALGGKFYVTEIEAHGGAGTVHYEDGHIAEVADFTYSVDVAGNPKVETFKVRK